MWLPVKIINYKYRLVSIVYQKKLNVRVLLAFRHKTPYLNDFWSHLLARGDSQCFVVVFHTVSRWLTDLFHDVSRWFHVFHCPVSSCFMTVNQAQWERAFSVITSSTLRSLVDRVSWCFSRKHNFYSCRSFCVINLGTFVQACFGKSGS